MASKSASSSAPPVPDASLVLFARGVIAILTSWPVLRIAISEHWGGPDSLRKRTWIASEIVDLFEASLNNAAPDADDVEDLLLQAMVDEFECEVDDGSAPKVAKEVVDLWKAVAESGEVANEAVGTLEARASKVKGTAVQVQRAAGDDDEDEDEEDDEDDDDEMDVDGDGEDKEEAPTLQPSKPSNEPGVDQDGFTVVKGKSRR